MWKALLCIDMYAELAGLPFHIHFDIRVVLMVPLSGFTLVSVLFSNSLPSCWSTGKTDVVFGSCQSSFLAIFFWWEIVKTNKNYLFCGNTEVR